MAAFALEFLHPANGARRIEFVVPRSVALLTDGRVWTTRLGGRRGAPEAMFLQLWPKEDSLRFRVEGASGTQSAAPPRLAKLNGAQVAEGRLKHADVLQWREVQISCVEIRPLPEPELAMVEAARTDDAALQVYADWLETKGATQSAEWARLVLSSGQAEKERMAVLASRVGSSFRSLVARGPVERCNQSSCGQRWEELALGDEPCKRTCSACSKTVTWCESAELARSVMGPVALDPSTPREPGDLLMRPPVVG